VKVETMQTPSRQPENPGASSAQALCARLSRVCQARAKGEGDLEEARRALAELARLPEGGPALAHWLTLSHDFDEPVKMFRELVLTSPLDQAAPNLAALGLALAGRPELAAQLLAQAIGLAPQAWRCRLNLARLHQAAGRDSQALESLDHPDGPPPELAPLVRELRQRCLDALGRTPGQGEKIAQPAAPPPWVEKEDAVVDWARGFIARMEGEGNGQFGDISLWKGLEAWLVDRAVGLVTKLTASGARP
jgi:tetratricopeptide (TPR) repeat protein